MGSPETTSSGDAERPPLLNEIEWLTEAVVPKGAKPGPEIRSWWMNRHGVVPECLEYYNHVPWVAECATLLATLPPLHVGEEMLGLIHLVVSQDNSCRYCYGTSRMILRMQGYSEKQVQKIERDIHLAELSPLQKAALEFAAGLAPEPIIEVAAMCAMANSLARPPFILEN